MKFKLISSVQSKHKFRKPYQNQLKLSLTNFSMVLDISTQKPLITPTNTMVILNSKTKKSILKPKLIETFNKYENKNINISKIGLLVK